MKKIYIPTEEELKKIQQLSGNDKLYMYILTKVVEKMLNEGMIIKNGDKELITIPEIASAICYVYPQEIMYSDIAKQDLNLFMRLIERIPNNSVEYFEYLFDASTTIQYDQNLVSKLITLLCQRLHDNPRYRFNYKESDILNSIFEIDYLRFNNYNNETKDNLMTIDPIYLIKFLEDSKIDRDIIRESGNRLSDKINTYSSRYGINKEIGFNYRTRDILKRPDEKVKKLVRFMNK